MRRHVLHLLLATVASALAVPTAAMADTGTSTNWSGYAIHRDRLHFSRVVGAWRQPSARCVRHNPTYSAFWVGIGGFSETSSALEQIGTEVDCTNSGSVASSAWYELVPAPSVNLSMRVRPGDSMVAIVSVNGRTVSMALRDTTRHRVFERNFRPSDIDTTSAEWIAEAPSACSSDTSCQTLPLADFGSTTFAIASARAASHTGSISDSRWGATEIFLNPGSRQYVNYSGVGPGIGTASPSSLGSKGTAFAIDFGTIPLSGTRFLATKADVPHALPGGRLVHPLR